jgi:radical SAM superfamily enzyme YgiQ (UPF0313 family)
VKNITLISLPNPTMTDSKIAPPLGLLYLAASSRRVNVKVIDLANMDDSSPLSCLVRLSNEKADLFGVSIASTQIGLAEGVCRALKANNPNTPLIVGGPHPTTLPGETLKLTHADIAVQGEGEQAWSLIIQGNADYGIYDPPSLMRCDQIKDLDTIPFPARELLDFSRYTRTIAGKPATNMITSRGCPGECIFCDQDIWVGKLRFHSSEYVLQEIDDIRDKTGIDRILFLDDTLTANRERMLEICEGLARRNVIWRGWTRADCIDPELLGYMKDSGCYSLCVGIESGSDTILRNIKKGITVEQNRQAITYIGAAGIKCRVSIMIGNPGETYETIEATKQFMVETIPDDWVVSTFIPVVGSPAWRNPSRFGFRILHRNYDDYFVVGYDQQSGLVMELDSISNEELMRERTSLIEFLEEHCPRKPEEVVQ